MCYRMSAHCQIYSVKKLFHIPPISFRPGSDMSDNVEGVTAKKLSLSLVYVADGDDHAKPLKCVLHSDAWKKNKAWETGEGADVKTPTCRVGILNISFGPKLNCSDKQVCNA